MTEDVFLDNGLILVRPQWFDCTSIKSTVWLNRVFGISDNEENGTDIAYQTWLEEKLEPINADKEPWDKEEPHYPDSHTEYVLQWLKETTGTEYSAGESGNTYNSEQDFYDQICYQVFYPSDDRAGSRGEWYYAGDVYMLACTHIGGDVRGNYRSGVLYGPLDSPCEAGLLDWRIQWSTEYLDGSRPDEDENYGPFQGSYEVQKHLKEYECPNRYSQPGRKENAIKWSDEHKCFLARWKDGRTVKLFPYVNVQG